MTIAPVAPLAGTRHADVIAGLRNLSAFLSTHLELPLGDGDPLHYAARGTDEETRAEVERIAAVLGTSVRVTIRGALWTAERDFGGGVRYTATAVSRDASGRYRAQARQFRATWDGDAA